MMDVWIHYTDSTFTSRCNIQDCYVIPEGIGVSATVEVFASMNVLPRAFLLSPYMLHYHNPPNRLSPLTLLWRCGACGKEQCVAKEALAPLTSEESGKRNSRITISNKEPEKTSHLRYTPFPPPSRQDPSLCPDCYCCPRCNASVLCIMLTYRLKYVARCTYCHWQHEAACAELSDLTSALNSTTSTKLLLPYREAVRKWRHSTENSRKAAEEACVSVSRLAIAEYTHYKVETSLHPAIALENLRDSVRRRSEKAMCDTPDWTPAFATLGEEEISHRVLEAEGAKQLQDSSDNDTLMRITQMEQHGFYLSSEHHPFWKHHGIDSRVPSYFLTHNIRQPLLATVLTSFTHDEIRHRDSCQVFLLNGVHHDPSFEDINEQLRTRSSGERRRCTVITMQLTAALYLPVLQHRKHRDALHDSKRWFAWRNFGSEEVVIRRCTIAREVGGMFSSSFLISSDASESEWVRLPPRPHNRDGCRAVSAMEEFSITLQRSGEEGEQVMVGFLLEVLTWLPVWQGEEERDESDMYDWTRHFFAAQDTGSIKRPYIATYGVTVVW